MLNFELIYYVLRPHKNDNHLICCKPRASFKHQKAYVKIIFLLFSVICFCSEAKIITTDKIKDIEIEFAETDNETFVVFNYDDVFLDPVDIALLTINEDASDTIATDVIKSKNIAKEEVITALSVLTRDMKTQLAHAKWPFLITALQSRGTQTLLLTSRGAGKQGILESVENVRRTHLLNVGIDFQKS